MTSRLSRKEELLLFKKEKAEKALLTESSRAAKKGAPSKSKVRNFPPAPGSVRSKVHISSNPTFFSSGTCSSAKNDRGVVNAGKRKIGASTPIGKLQARIRTSGLNSSTNKENSTVCSKNLFGSDDVSFDDKKAPCVSAPDVSKAVLMKMEEAEYLNEKQGCHVARAFMEALPKDDECANLELLSRAMFWLTWIKIEQNAHEWERAEQLFGRAGSLVRTSSDRAVIAAAYEAFREEADSVLEDKMNSIAATTAAAAPQPAAVSSFVPKVNSKRKIDSIDVISNDESEPSVEGPTQLGKVSSLRKKFETGMCNATKNSSSVSVGAANSVRQLAQRLGGGDLVAIQKRSLAGAVALPGMLPPPLPLSQGSEVSAAAGDDALSALLGISGSQEEEEDAASESNGEVQADAPVAKKLCQTRAPTRVGMCEDGIFSDEDDDSDVEGSTDEHVQVSKPAVANAVQPPTTLSSPRTTRSGVKFAEQLSAATPPTKGPLSHSKKRRVTPFKPHVDDLILSPY